MRRASLTKEKQGGFYQNKVLKSWIFQASIYAVAEVAFITARIIAYLQYLKLNMQRDMQKADLWMTLWHTFNSRSNKAMRWLALISFKSLNTKIKSFEKCLNHWERIISLRFWRCCASSQKLGELNTEVFTHIPFHLHYILLFQFFFLA